MYVEILNTQTTCSKVYPKVCGDQWNLSSVLAWRRHSTGGSIFTWEYTQLNLLIPFEVQILEIPCTCAQGHTTMYGSTSTGYFSKIKTTQMSTRKERDELWGNSSNVNFVGTEKPCRDWYRWHYSIHLKFKCPKHYISYGQTNVEKKIG